MASKTTRKTTKMADGEADVLAKVAAMRAPHRAMGERLHALIPKSAPGLQPRVWYGMPGYAKNGPVLCFFRVDEKYVTFGPTEKANHIQEDGAPDQLMASLWFFTTLDDATEARLSAIVQTAVS